MVEGSSNWIYAVKATFTIVILIVLLFFVSSYFLAQLLGLTLFYFAPEGVLFSLKLIDPPIVFIPLLLLPILIPVKGNYGALFLLIWSIFGFCLIGAFITREGFIKSLKNLSNNLLSSLFRNNILSMPLITSILLAVSILLTLLQESSGVPSGPGPSFPTPYADFFWLSMAPITEELGFRIIPLGFFLMVYIVSSINRDASFRFKLKLFFLSFIYPDKAKESLGLMSINNSGLLRGIRPFEWFIVAATSFLFGYAHVYFGGGVWELGKVAPTTVVGFIFALSYLYYGIQAPILLHWFFNFYWQSLHLASNTYPILSFLYETMEGLTFFVGAVGIASLAAIAVLRIAKIKV